MQNPLHCCPSPLPQTHQICIVLLPQRCCIKEIRRGDMCNGDGNGVSVWVRSAENSRSATAPFRISDKTTRRKSRIQRFLHSLDAVTDLWALCVWLVGEAACLYATNVRNALDGTEWRTFCARVGVFCSGVFFLEGALFLGFATQMCVTKFR